MTFEINNHKILEFPHTFSETLQQFYARGEQVDSLNAAGGEEVQGLQVAMESQLMKDGNVTGLTLPYSGLRVYKSNDGNRISILVSTERLEESGLPGSDNLNQQNTQRNRKIMGAVTELGQLNDATLAELGIQREALDHVQFISLLHKGSEDDKGH
jgi:hypothetical protein